jgi:quinohemoprotein ethanol dehydrogenase
MSFNPQTGLVYIPAQGIPTVMRENKEWEQNKVVSYGAGTGWNTAIVFGGMAAKTPVFGRLLAWDPVKQQEAWRHDYVSPWNGGTLTTAGNLVFQGAADGRFIAYNATTGETLWESPTGTGIVAGPATYLVDGVQYVSVAVGWGGSFGIGRRLTEVDAPGTVFTFAIGGKAPLPKFAMFQQHDLISGINYDQADVRPGQLLYTSYCATCHGTPGGSKGGNVPNLGFVASEEITNLEAMVFKGPFTDKGMPDFTGKLKADEVVKIRAFIASAADAIRKKN